MALTQDGRLLAIDTPLGPNVLVLQQLTGTEDISRPFAFTLDLLSETPSIALESMLGQRVTIRIARTGGGRPRVINGLVNRFALGRREGSLTHYEAEIVPWLWFLTLTTNCRISRQELCPAGSAALGVGGKQLPDRFRSKPRALRESAHGPAIGDTVQAAPYDAPADRPRTRLQCGADAALPASSAPSHERPADTLDPGGQQRDLQRDPLRGHKGERAALDPCRTKPRDCGRERQARAGRQSRDDHDWERAPGNHRRGPPNNGGLAQEAEVGADQATTIGRNRRVSVAGTDTVQVGGARATTIGGTDSLSAGQSLTITVADQVLITTGQASILMKRDGTITIEGSTIALRASGDIILKGSKIVQN